MKKLLFSGMLSLLALSLAGSEPINETLMRLAPVKKAPVIDGVNSYNEWKYANAFFGGTSPYTKMMTYY